MKQQITIGKPHVGVKIDPQKTSVLILAAGHGTRMRPLTDNTPKPLLKVGKHSLIEQHIYKLSAFGFKHIVINTAYLGHKIQQRLGNGKRYAVTISYSDESATGALETAGGIKQSLPLINSDPFLVINADIYTDFDFSSMLEITSDKLGCLLLVPNPSHNPDGDFNVDKPIESTMTFSGIALYRKKIFNLLPEGKLALGPILKRMVDDDMLVARPYYGSWTDVGTPERLRELNSTIQSLS
ncbi:MAG: MurNAc alpha-1-phosphate uridylyltransferase [Arenicella sp.]|jgi:MurNAc alpha-1-phosphate uridylyltransferase